jgi:hypothetical protein
MKSKTAKRISIIMLSLLCAAGRSYASGKADGKPAAASVLDARINQAVESLSRSTGRQMSIAVGRIAYEDTSTVSALSAYVKNAINDGVRGKPQGTFRIAGDADCVKLIEARAKSRSLGKGLTVEPLEADIPVDAIVDGSFFTEGSSLRVTLELVSLSGEVLAETSFDVPLSELEQKRLGILPVNGASEISVADFERKQECLEPYSDTDDAGRFIFGVTPDDLDGIYYDGESMTMRIYSERDCYFRIVHVDVNGMSQVIYPTTAADNNRISAGEIRKIPDNTRYRLGKPYGEEYILVAAYDEPFTVQPEPPAQITAAAVEKGLYVEPVSSGGQPSMSPIATAKFSYTILPK